MNRSLLSALILVAALPSCAGASYPSPNQRMVDAKSSAKSAEENAQVSPRARLHVALAKEAIERADALMANGENRRADYELVRAKSDADLAVALEKARAAHREAEQASARARAIQSQNQPASGGEQ
ncbi:MAG: hypothetical protein ACRENE_08690 [Polyangiaceae bacterium]